MSLKGSKTTADYLAWDKMLLLIQKLYRDKDYHFAILIATGSYTGLRISDLSRLQWKDIKPTLEIVEKKTGKMRTIHLNTELMQFLVQIKGDTKPKESDLLFPYSLQYTNRKLKRIATDYKLDIQFSTHSFRKTFGRRIWSKNGYSEKSLILLGQIFNHSSVAITKRYLGIRDKEIQDIYLSL